MKTTKELWGALERKYKTEDAGTKKFFIARFLEFKIIDSKSVVSQVQELQVIIHDLFAEVLIAERKRKLGLPPEDPASHKPSTAPVVEEKKSSFLPVRPATKAERMRECLRTLKRTHKDDDAKVKTAFNTLLTYAKNVATNPNEKKFRKIRLLVMLLFSGHKKWITGISWEPVHLSAPCRRFVSASKDGDARIWDVTTRKCLICLTDHTLAITCVKWGGDGVIYTGSQDCTIKVWETTQRKLIRELKRNLCLYSNFVQYVSQFEQLQDGPRPSIVD
ncbi:hypothetical protein P3L10_020488 [Capsicum annuum]